MKNKNLVYTTQYSVSGNGNFIIFSSQWPGENEVPKQIL